MSTNESKVELSSAWLDEDDMEDEAEEVFGGGFQSDRIEGYQAVDTKIIMAYQVKSGSSKAEAIKITFSNKDGQTHEETFWVKGRDGKPFTVKNGKKIQTFGVNKIRSLIKVVGLFKDSKNLMASLYSDVSTADVTETVFGKEETNEQEVFNALIGKKVKLCISSKKVNATASAEQDDKDEQKYIDQCIKDTKKFIIANPKKKSLKKYGEVKDYPNVYKWFIESSIQHFVSIDGKFADELDLDEGKKLTQFLEANKEGFISDGRTLIADDMTDAQLAKLGINKYGKRVEIDSSDDSYEEPVEEVEDEDEEW